ncbi:MAG: hypothetical protein VX063_01880, partial [SAR324 cluster bacterium]|nr:hypothetical protein [SAR324 cluster bacterium]
MFLPQKISQIIQTKRKIVLNISRQEFSVNESARIQTQKAGDLFFLLEEQSILRFFLVLLLESSGIERIHGRHRWVTTVPFSNPILFG